MAEMKLEKNQVILCGDVMEKNDDHVLILTEAYSNRTKQTYQEFHKVYFGDNGKKLPDKGRVRIFGCFKQVETDEGPRTRIQMLAIEKAKKSDPYENKALVAGAVTQDVQALPSEAGKTTVGNIFLRGTNVFHRGVLFGAAAIKAERLYKQDDMVEMKGNVRHRGYTTKDGREGVMTELVNVGMRLLKKAPPDTSFERFKELEGDAV